MPGEVLPLMWVSTISPPPPVESNISYVNSGAVGANDTAAPTLAVPYPSTIAAGNLLILHYAGNGGTASYPTGWIPVARIMPGTNPRLMVAIKIADGTESGTLTVSTSTVTSTGQIHQFSGVDMTTPLDTAAQEIENATTTSTTVLPATTTVTNNAVGVFMGASNSGSLTATSADGIEIGEFPDVKSGAAYYTPPVSPAGTIGPLTITWSSSRTNCGALIILRPA